MENRLGITAWTVPWQGEELCAAAEEEGLLALHLDLGSAAKGYPLMKQENRAMWLEGANKHHLQIVALALNDLCNHGFTAGIKDARAEIAVTTMLYAVETARSMGIPALSVPHFFANRMVDEASFHATAEALRFLCDRAQEHGILVYTENVLDASALARLWQEVDRPNLRLLFDTQNYAVLSDVDAADIFEKWHDQCGAYIHLKDGDGALGNRALWQGASGFERVLAAVLRQGYGGDMILESNYGDRETLKRDLAGVRSRIGHKQERNESE